MLGPTGKGREASLAAGSEQERGERGVGEAGRTRLGKACRLCKECEPYSKCNEMTL